MEEQQKISAMTPLSVSLELDGLFASGSCSLLSLSLSLSLSLWEFVSWYVCVNSFRLKLL